MSPASTATEYVPILFAASPFAAMRSAPTTTALMRPSFMTWPAIESQISVVGTWRRVSSTPSIARPLQQGTRFVGVDVDSLAGPLRGE